MAATASRVDLDARRPDVGRASRVHQVQFISCHSEGSPSGMKDSPLILVSWCLALPLAALAQTTYAPSIRTGTKIVVVDVTVTDAHGNPVHNLKPSDFRVLENGDPQSVSHFEEHSRPAAAELEKAYAKPAIEPNVYTNFTLMPEGEPVTLLVFDILNTPVEKQA